MKITSYEDLNKLVAQSLGWIKAIYLERQSVISDVEIEFYHPPNAEEKEAEAWFKEYDVAPNFSEDWSCVEKFLLLECDRRDLLIEWRRSPQSIVCVIAASAEMYYPGVMVWTGKGFKYPRSMCLATCLAWLYFNSIAFSWGIEGDRLNLCNEY